MNAPDKIYVDTDLIAFHVMNERLNEVDVEYIRKDALLEWAKEQKKQCEDIIKQHPEDDSLWCERDKYDELIDKINSL